jgi:phosphoesterase RecJ-like protein
VVLIELPYATLALWGRMLAGIGERQGGRVVYATLTQRMLDETGTQQHDADGLAEFLARAKEAQVTLLLRELGPTETRVSVRCADGVDATVVAAPFGGGGHRSRSGATVHAWLDDALPQVLAAAERALPG